MSKSSQASGVAVCSKDVPDKQTKAARDLLYLVSCAINKKPVSAERCAKMDLDKVYRLAQYHSLSAAAAFALEQVTELPREFDQAKKKAIRKLALFDIERGKIFREFERQGIRCLPLKGTVIGACYPKAAMREMNDNDILCEPDKMASVKEVMTGLGYTCEHYAEGDHDVYTKPPTMSFEMHRALFDKELHPVFEYYRDIWDRLLDDGGCLLRMTDEDSYLYLIAHAYKHYVSAGIGLRTLADVYLFRKAHDGSLRREYLDEQLDKLKLTAFERSFSSLAQKAFTCQPLSEKEKKEMSYLIASGTHGNRENRVFHQTLNDLRGDDSARAKRKLLLRRAFISGEDLKEKYPVVCRHKGLYPLLLVYRPVKGLFTHPRKILSDYRKIKAFRKDDENAFNYKNADTKND